MSDTINDGGPAFPRAAFATHDVGFEDIGIHDSQEGMTLRDWFAGHVLSATANAAMPAGQIANDAYRLADAMLRERQKGGAN